VRRTERNVLEQAVAAVTEQAVNADALVDEAIAAGLDGSHRVTVMAKDPAAGAPEREGGSRA
jgi:hypothetical protein